MGIPRGVKRDFSALEARRMRAARLFQQGMSQAEIARALGVHRQTVHRWVKRAKRGGRGALKKAGRAGRKPRLSFAEIRRITQELKRGPEVLGYETSFWTTPRVVDLIERECGVRYHPGHVWKILRQMGWRWQRPTGRALKRAKPRIRRWKKQLRPKLKKGPNRGPKNRLRR